MQTRPQQAMATQQTERDRTRAMVESMIPAIAKVLPKHLTPERMAQIVIVEMSRNPKLRNCTRESLAASIMMASELGLEPSGPRGHAWLIPRNNKIRGIHGEPDRWEMQCSLQIGYKGLIDLAYRSGRIARLNASVVYQSELDCGAFRATIEPPEIRHAWSPTVERSDATIVAAYATAEMTDGAKAQVILTRADIESRRSRSEATKRGWSSPWDSDYAAMARKSALRALLSGGLVPLSSELATALEEDEAITTTATEQPPELEPRQQLAPQRTTPLLASPDPDPPSQLLAEVIAQIEKWPDRHQGIVPDWLPSAVRAAQMSEEQLQALLDRMVAEG
jgi:recombination protein RecT